MDDSGGYGGRRGSFSRCVKLRRLKPKRLGDCAEPVIGNVHLPPFDLGQVPLRHVDEIAELFQREPARLALLSDDLA